MNGKTAANIDEYIADFPEETRALLEEMRATIAEAAPLAEETISYQMPAFKYNGILVYFAGYKKHIGLYPAGAVLVDLEEELKPYRTSKGTLQFPLNKPLPTDLITRIVLHRVAENQGKPKRK